jgi:protoheme IX farnesyltransferase
MSLVVFTGLVGMVLAPSGLSPAVGALAILCIAVGAGAAGALNMWYDRDIDSIMTRTASRPIPAGKVAPIGALWFGITLSVLSVGVLGVMTNWIAGSLLAATILYYIFIYTAWLKRRSTLGIVVGGAAGALPPVVGWAAASGSVGVPILTLFAIIFLWTPPHTWALALFRSDDFAKANLPLLPLRKGVSAAKIQIFVYALILMPVGLLPYFTGLAGVIYLILAALLGAGFVGGAWKLLRSSEADTEAEAGSLFKYSIAYLFILFATLLGERIVFFLATG